MNITFKSILITIAVLFGSVANAQIFEVQEGVYSPMGNSDMTVHLTKGVAGDLFEFELNSETETITASMEMDPEISCLRQGTGFMVCPVYSGSGDDLHYEGIVVNIEGDQTFYVLNQ